MLTGPRVLKHVQIREHVWALLADAPPGTGAPSERDLVAQFGVARMTVRKALDALIAQGRLERVPGCGTFVAHPRRRLGHLSSYTEDMKIRGLLPTSQTLVVRRELAGSGVARALDISPGAVVIHWKRLRRADQQVVCVEDAYLNATMLPGFLQRGTPASLYDALDERGLRPTEAEDAISAEAATLDEATLLEIEPGSPVLRLSRRALCGDKVVNVSRTAFRPDRFTMYLRLGNTA